MEDDIEYRPEWEPYLPVYKVTKFFEHRREKAEREEAQKEAEEESGIDIAEEGQQGIMNQIIFNCPFSFLF